MRRITRRSLPLNALRAFESVARHESFTGAAHALLMSQSSLSQQVIGLEQALGVRLFARGPRGIALTRAGARMQSAVAKSLDRLQYAFEDIGRGKAPARRALRVRMPLSLALQIAVPIVQDLRRLGMDLDMDLSTASAAAPALADVDLAVMYACPPPDRFAADLLWRVTLRILCHPRLAARYLGSSLAEFIEANEIAHVLDEDGSGQEPWREFMRHHGLGDLNCRHTLGFHSAAVAAAYVAGGEGIMLGDPRLFGAQIACGRLVSPFSAELATGAACYLVTHRLGQPDPAVALLREGLMERLAEQRAAAGPR